MIKVIIYGWRIDFHQSERVTIRPHRPFAMINHLAMKVATLPFVSVSEIR